MNPEPNTVRSFFPLVGCTLLVRCLTQLGYQWFILPQLPNVQSVPHWWWGVLLTPLISSLVVLGYVARPLPVRVYLSAIVAFFFIVEDYVFWRLHLPGHRKEPYLEITAFALQTAVVFIPIWVGHLALRLRERYASILPV